MPKVFVIGDTHFLHEKIKKYTGRPEKFNRMIIDNWNRVVGPDDLVIHLGDLTAGLKGRYALLVRMVNMLNGQRILIRGNHDHFSVKKYKEDMGFTEVYEHLVLEDILFTHYPLEITQYSKPKEVHNVKELERVVSANGINHIIHGHTHNRDTGLDNHYNCSVECIDYTPVEISVFLKGKRTS